MHGIHHFNTLVTMSEEQMFTPRKSKKYRTLERVKNDYADNCHTGMSQQKKYILLNLLYLIPTTHSRILIGTTR